LTNPDLELNLLHHGDSGRSVVSATVLAEAETIEADAEEPPAPTNHAVSMRKRSYGRSSCEDLLLDIIEGYFPAETASDEAESEVVDLGESDDTGSDSSQLGATISVNDADFAATMSQPAKSLNERDIHDLENGDYYEAPRRRADGDRVLLLDGVEEVEYVEIEEGFQDNGAVGLKSKDLEELMKTLDSRAPLSMQKDPLQQELERCARLGKCRRCEREALFQQAKSHPGREAAEELHEALHPRYWGITRAQLAKFESDLGEAVRRGQVLNTCIVGDTTHDYTDELFERDGPTMRQTNAMFIRPRTNETASILPFASYALQCNDEAGLECELFVSHCWDQGVFDFVTTLLSVWPHRCAGAFISSLSCPQNLGMNEILGDPYDSPFFKVLMSQPRLMIMVATEMTAIHERLWCSFEAYSAHFLGVPIEIAGNPVYLVPREHRVQLESTLAMAVGIRLQEFRQLGATSEDLRKNGRLYYFGADEVASQSLRGLVHAAAPAVHEAMCFSARDRAVILAEMAQGMAAVNVFIKQQLLKRFAQECQNRIFISLEERVDVGRHSEDGPHGPEVSTMISMRPMAGIQQRLQDFKRKREEEKRRELLTVLTWGIVLLTLGTVIQSVAGIAKWVRHQDHDHWTETFNMIGVTMCIVGFLVMSNFPKVDFDDLVVEHSLASAGLFAFSAILSCIKGKYICLLPCMLGVLRCQCPSVRISPFATTCMALYWLLESLPPGRSISEPPLSPPLSVVLSGLFQATFYVADRFWGTTYENWRCPPAACCDSDLWQSRATPAAYHLLYLHCLVASLTKLIGQGKVYFSTDCGLKCDQPLDFFQIFEAICLLLPLLGRDLLTRSFERHFESQKDRRERDGAFIAEMLGDVQIECGQPWWIHLEAGEKNSLHPEWHHQHHFALGRVVEVTEMNFSVRIPKDPKPRVLPLAGRNLSQDELVRLGRSSLRCIEWEKLSRRLFTGKNKNGRQDAVVNAYQLSRPVRPGERIDYFLSHSWHDDGDDKYDHLEDISAQFRQKHGRFPTFWLDVVCISQDNIGDGLAVLPVNVMACHRILALAGSSYPKRLWCAVELATLFSFMPAQQAIRRVQLQPVGSRREQVLTELAHFKVSDAHCYDPNEEEKILRVIDAVSTHHFENNIRMLANRLAQDMNKSANMVDIVARENALRRQNEILQREVDRHKSERETALQLLNETREEVRKLKQDNDRLRAQRQELMVSLGDPQLANSIAQQDMPSSPKAPPAQGRACSHSSFLAEAQEDLLHGDLLQDLPTRPSKLARARWMLRD